MTKFEILNRAPAVKKVSRRGAINFITHVRDRRQKWHNDRNHAVASVHTV